MKTQAMETSFDVICERSQLRHYKTLDVVRKGLQKSLPQSDQVESTLQNMVDKAETGLGGILLSQTKKSNELASAEWFAERCDWLVWSEYSKSSISS